jgi:hypothetical protein
VFFNIQISIGRNKKNTISNIFKIIHFKNIEDNYFILARQPVPLLILLDINILNYYINKDNNNYNILCCFIYVLIVY